MIINRRASAIQEVPNCWTEIRVERLDVSRKSCNCRSVAEHRTDSELRDVTERA